MQTLSKLSHQAPIGLAEADDDLCRSEDLNPASTTLLPIGVVRRAGVPLSEWRRLAFDGSARLAEECLELESRCRRERDFLCALLASTIAKGQSARITRELIALRRDIYNDRAPRRALPHEARQVLRVALSDSEVKRLENWLEIRSHREVLVQRGASALAEETASVRASLRRLTGDREFTGALALASTTLSRELIFYAEAEDISDRRMRQIELAVLRYYARATFKLSPFSTFTTTALIRFDDTARESPAQEDTEFVRSAKVNRAMIANLVQAMILDPELAPWLPVYGNRAVLRNGRKVMAMRRNTNLVMSARLRVPRESFVTFSAGQAIDEVLAFLVDCGGSVRRGDLVAAWSRQIGSERAASFIGTLLDLGILVHSVLLPHDDSGIAELCAVLAQVPCQKAAGLRRILHSIDALCRRLPDATQKERHDLLAGFETHTADLFRQLRPNASPVWKNMLLFEDCVAHRSPQGYPIHDYQAPLNELCRFVKAFGTVLDYNVSHRETLRNILRHDFGGGPVSFLEFAAHCQGLLPAGPDDLSQKWSEHTPNPLNLPSLSALAKIRAELFATLCQPCVEHEIDLCAVAVNYGLHGLASRFRQSAECISCSWQPFSYPDGLPGIVVNSVGDGPARVLLRACGALPDGPDRQRVLSQLTEAIEGIWPGVEPCELAASFDYNVNFHPRVTRRTIAYGDEIISGQSVSLASLQLQMTSAGVLSVIDAASGREVAPLAFGMMIASLAPFAYQLLAGIYSVCMIMPKLFRPYRYTTQSQDQDVVAFPRLVYGRCVIRRRGWSVIKTAVPERGKLETDFSYLLRLRRWLTAIGIPQQVFIYSQANDPTPSARLANRRAWNRLKPLYIDFRNHFLISTFAKAAAETRNLLYIEEMLPSTTDWEKSRSDRAMEFTTDFVTRHPS